MKFVLTKAFRFEAAHRLTNYEGKCANIHGHSWNGEITVQTYALDEKQMAVDYTILGQFTKDVETLLDHKMIVSEDDKDMIFFCQVNDMQFVETKGNPTCETIAWTLFKNLNGFLAGRGLIHVTPVSVTIKETCTTSCTYYE